MRGQQNDLVKRFFLEKMQYKLILKCHHKANNSLKWLFTHHSTPIEGVLRLFFFLSLQHFAHLCFVNPPVSYVMLSRVTHNLYFLGFTFSIPIH